MNNEEHVHSQAHATWTLPQEMHGRYDWIFGLLTISSISTFLGLWIWRLALSSQFNDKEIIIALVLIFPMIFGFNLLVEE